MRKIHYSRKLKQFKVLSRRVQFLLKQSDEEAVFQLQKLRSKLKKLFFDLKFAYSGLELKRILGAAILVFGLSFSNQAHAQWFDAPVINPFGLSATNDLALPAVADLDNDGDMDLLVGEYYGNLQYFENTGSASDASFATPVQNPFGIVSGYYFALPSFADLDNDGDFDLLINEYYGVFTFYENIGTASAPAFDTPLTNPFGLDSSGYLVSPVFVDIDNDGDFDLLCGSYVYNSYNGNEGIIKYYENTGSASSPSFAEPVENPFSFVNPDTEGGFIFPTFGDLDEDGDFDLLVNSESGIFYFENIGTSVDPEFGEGLASEFNLLETEFTVSPVLVDMDDDSDLDLLIGGYGGEYSNVANFHYYENLGTLWIGIDDITSAINLNVYPNPVEDLLAIDTDKQIDRIEMIDVLGKTSLMNVSASNQLDLSDASPGIYTLKISFLDGSYAVKKILKE